MPSLRESTTAVVVRGEHVTNGFASEPYEAGWAVEAILFLRVLDDLAAGGIVVELSPDGMHWAADGDALDFPTAAQPLTFRRVAHFGNWLRLRVVMPEGAKVQLLATLHLKG